MKNKKYEKRIKKNKIENGKFYEKIIFRKNQKKEKKKIKIILPFTQKVNNTYFVLFFIVNFIYKND